MPDGESGDRFLRIKGSHKKHREITPDTWEQGNERRKETETGMMDGGRGEEGEEEEKFIRSGQGNFDQRVSR